MTVRVKICGITNEADARQAIDAGADAIGFVFVPGTPRQVNVESVAGWVRRLPPLVSRVGLFVDAELNWIRGVIRETGIDTVQLHGDEPPGLAHGLRNEVRVLKAFRMRGSETLRRLPDYREAADGFLLDAYVPGQAGGTGATFDWEQAVAARQLALPVILAGGLTPENVAEAIRRVSPYAVDVSSGVERSPGRKDPDKVRRFIAEAKRAGWERQTTDNRRQTTVQ